VNHHPGPAGKEARGGSTTKQLTEQEHRVLPFDDRFECAIQANHSPKGCLRKYRHKPVSERDSGHHQTTRKKAVELACARTRSTRICICPNPTLVLDASQTEDQGA